MEPKTANYLFYKKAETSVKAGFTTLTVRGRKSIFRAARYEVLVENGATGESSIKAAGPYVDAMLALKRSPKAWNAAREALERVAEALSDDSRNVRKGFTRSELTMLAALDSPRRMDELPKFAHLEGRKVSEALESLQGKGLVAIEHHGEASLTAAGAAIRKCLEGDPIFERMAGLIHRT
ncbi:MAG: hypothetical protein AB1529_06980 [Candidatus Micrarchaeota archaeon]